MWPRPCSACAASAPSRASAASPARCASRSIPDHLLAMGATASDISRQLRQIQQEASGGRTDVGSAEQSVRLIATVQTAAELASMEIPLSDGRRIRLGQVASVEDTTAEQRTAAFLNGMPVVGFEIVRSRGGRRSRRDVRRARADPQAQGKAPGYHGERSLQLRRSDRRKLRRVDGVDVRGCGARGAGGLALSARLARRPWFPPRRCRCRSSPRLP